MFIKYGSGFGGWRRVLGLDWRGLGWLNAA
jgi:hypothetical protein